jgi:PAS domain S-box-containing protein
MFPEKLSQQIIENAPDAILYVDKKGLIQHWNAGATRIFGYYADEALGKSLDLIIPEKLRGRHWNGYYKAMESGKSQYGTDLLSVPATHKGGQRLSVDFCIVMLKNDQGLVEGIAAIMRDMTDQRQKEKQLKERITELEGKEG